MSPERGRVRSWFDRLKGWFARNEMFLVIVTLVFLIVLTFFWGNIVISIRSGETGVLWSRIFGTTTDRLYLEGTQIIPPWNVMTIYNVRYQHVDRTFLVLSRDGLQISVDVTIRFKPMDKQVPKLHQQVGPTYVDTVVSPEVNTAVRTVIGRFRPDELYAASVDEIQADILNMARREVRNRFVEVDDVLLRRIVLPQTVADAIQRKLEQEQLSLEMQYRLSRERQEADRKRIESEGIRDYNRTVEVSLTPRLLQFKGIDATLELARSTNSKVVVIGSGRDGLPLILNADSAVPAARLETPVAARLDTAAAPATAAGGHVQTDSGNPSSAAAAGYPERPTARRPGTDFREDFDTETPTARIPGQRSRGEDLLDTGAARYPEQPGEDDQLGRPRGNPSSPPTPAGNPSPPPAAGSVLGAQRPAPPK